MDDHDHFFLVNSILSTKTAEEGILELMEKKEVLGRKVLFLQEGIADAKAKIQNMNYDESIKCLKDKLFHKSTALHVITTRLLELTEKEVQVVEKIKVVEKVQSFKKALSLLLSTTHTDTLPTPLLLRGIEDLFLSLETVLPSGLAQQYLEYKEKLSQSILTQGFKGSFGFGSDAQSYKSKTNTTEENDNFGLMEIMCKDDLWREGLVEEIVKNIKTPNEDGHHKQQQQHQQHNNIKELFQSLHCSLDLLSINPRKEEENIKILTIHHFTTTKVLPLILQILKQKNHSLIRKSFKECKAFEGFVAQKYSITMQSLSVTFSQHLFFIIEGHDSGIVGYLEGLSTSSDTGRRTILLEDSIVEDSAPHLFLLFRELLDDVKDCCGGYGFSAAVFVTSIASADCSTIKPTTKPTTKTTTKPTTKTTNDDININTTNKYLLVVCSVIRKSLLSYLELLKRNSINGTNGKESIESRITVLAQKTSTVEYTLRSMHSLVRCLKDSIGPQYEEAIEFTDIEDDFILFKKALLEKTCSLLRENQLVVIFRKGAIADNGRWIIELMDWISNVIMVIKPILKEKSYLSVMESVANAVQHSFIRLIKGKAPLDLVATETIERLLVDILTIKSSIGAALFRCADIELLLKTFLVPLEPTCTFVENYISLCRRHTISGVFGGPCGSVDFGGFGVGLENKNDNNDNNKNNNKTDSNRENFLILLSLTSLRKESGRYKSYIEAWDRMVSSTDCADGPQSPVV